MSTSIVGKVSILFYFVAEIILPNKIGRIKYKDYQFKISFKLKDAMYTPKAYLAPHLGYTTENANYDQVNKKKSAIEFLVE